MADISLQASHGRCKTCCFWASSVSDFDNIAQCRRFPPVRVKAQNTGQWPQVNQADWCGEYEALV